MTNAIEINSLIKRFGSFTAVSDVTMDVRKGQFMGLLGPNGAGKSTMLKVITGMISPTSGNVRVNGHDISDHRMSMATVGCVIETPECYPDLTPTEVLSYVGRLRGMTRGDMPHRIRDVLEEVRMWEWRNKPVGTFSKGMRQRVTLAQALLPDPEILVLDEPTSGLDPRGMVEVREILNGLNDGSRSLLISTHMLNEVSELCDGVTVIRRGVKVMGGSVRELQRSVTGEAVLEIGVRKPVTSEFLQSVRRHDDVQDVEKVDEYTFMADLTNHDVDREWIVDLIRQYGLGLLTIRQKGSDLEDLYMSLTGDGDDDVK